MAEEAIATLKDIRPRLLKAMQELKPMLDTTATAEIDGATDKGHRGLGVV